MENIKFTPFAIRKIYHSREIEIIVTIYLKYYTFMHISAIIYPATLTIDMRITRNFCYAFKLLIFH